MIEMGGQHQGGVKGGGPGSEPGHSPGGGVSPSGGYPHPSRSPVAATPGNNPNYPDNLNASPHSSGGPSPIPPTAEHRYVTRIIDISVTRHVRNSAQSLTALKDLI